MTDTVDGHMRRLRRCLPAHRQATFRASGVPPVVWSASAASTAATTVRWRNARRRREPVKVEPIEVEEQTALEAMRSVGRMMSGRIERWEWQTSDRSAPALEKIVIREAQP